MNKIAKTVLLIVLAGTFLTAGCAAESAAVIGGRAPDFQLKDLDGQSVSLSDLKGSPVVLNFWASWCGPCRMEMPYLQQIYEEWAGRGLVMLTVNLGENREQVSEFLQANNLSLPVVLDTAGNVGRKYNVSGIPTTFFIDSSGVVRQKVIGTFPSKEVIEEELVSIIP